LVLLPEQRDPRPGIWRLHLTHPPAGGDERVTVTASLLDRFLLSLTASEPHATAGQPIVLSILAMDYGRPMMRQSPQIQVLREDKPLGAPLTAGESVTAPSRIRLSNEPGTYLASYIPSSQGVYHFITRIAFPGREGPVIKTADTTVVVGPELVSLRRMEVRPIREPGGCIKTIDFLLELSVKKPGTYTLSLFLDASDGGELELSATRESEAGVLTYQIPLPAKTARRKLNTTLIDEVKRIDVLRFDTLGVTLVGRYGARRIQSPVSLSEICK